MPEVGYTVTVPSLLGCVTYGKTIEDAIEMANEAIELYIESLKEMGKRTKSLDAIGKAHAPKKYL